MSETPTPEEVRRGCAVWLLATAIFVLGWSVLVLAAAAVWGRMVGR